MKNTKRLIYLLLILFCCSCSKSGNSYEISNRTDFFLEVGEIDSNDKISYSIVNNSNNTIYYGDPSGLLIQKLKGNVWNDVKWMAGSYGYTELLMSLPAGETRTYSRNLSFVRETYGAGKYRLLLGTVNEAEGKLSRGPYLVAEFQLD